MSDSLARVSLRPAQIKASDQKIKFGAAGSVIGRLWQSITKEEKVCGAALLHDLRRAAQAQLKCGLAGARHA